MHQSHTGDTHAQPLPEHAVCGLRLLRKHVKPPKCNPVLAYRGHGCSIFLPSSSLEFPFFDLK
jgi:hypothetical protein